PIFDVSFQFNNFEVPRLEIPELTIGAYRYNSRISKFDLTIWASETAEDLTFAFEYSTRLFKRETIKTFIRYFREIAGSIVANPRQDLGQLQCMSKENREELLKRLNREMEAEVSRFSRMEQVLQHRLNRSFQKFHHHIALEYGAQTLTYEELGHQSKRVALGITEKSIPPGTFIGVLISNRVNLVSAALGILKSRCVFVPLDDSYPRQRLEMMVTLTGTPFILVDSEHALFFDENGFKETEKPEIIRMDSWFEAGSTEELTHFNVSDRQYQPEDQIYVSDRQ
ncbi:MAG: AMP-binding protein, partial [bacterium]|nr:AMP-binding protein [bacterium]